MDFDISNLEPEVIQISLLKGQPYFAVKYDGMWMFELRFRGMIKYNVDLSKFLSNYTFSYVEKNLPSRVIDHKDLYYYAGECWKTLQSYQTLIYISYGVKPTLVDTDLYYSKEFLESMILNNVNEYAYLILSHNTIHDLTCKVRSPSCEDDEIVSVPDKRNIVMKGLYSLLRRYRKSPGMMGKYSRKIFG